MIKPRRKRKVIKTYSKKTGVGFYGFLLVWWVVVFLGLVIMVEPTIVKDFIMPNAYVIFYGLVFVILWLMTILIRKQIIKGFVWALGGCFGLILYRYGLASWFNLGLLLCLLMIFEGLTIKPKVE